jgi:hypothetical protein
LLALSPSLGLKATKFSRGPSTGLGLPEVSIELSTILNLVALSSVRATMSVPKLYFLKYSLSRGVGFP